MAAVVWSNSLMSSVGLHLRCPIHAANFPLGHCWQHRVEGMYDAEPAAELHCLTASHAQLLEAVGEQDMSKGGGTATSCSIPNSNRSQPWLEGSVFRTLLIQLDSSRVFRALRKILVLTKPQSSTNLLLLTTPIAWALTRGSARTPPLKSFRWSAQSHTRRDIRFSPSTAKLVRIPLPARIQELQEEQILLLDLARLMPFCLASDFAQHMKDRGQPGLHSKYQDSQNKIKDTVPHYVALARLALKLALELSCLCLLMAVLFFIIFFSCLHCHLL